jgi:hypothetical protein
MAFKYEEVVPWGRNFDEYCAMFALTQDDLSKRILGCGDGPASFNCTCNARSGHVVSIDPLYALSREQIRERIRVTFDNVISQTRKNQEKFRWNRIKSVEVLGRIRMKAMDAFLESYEQGKLRGQYLAGSLPSLDFPDDCFDIALSSHFLFLYTDHLTYDFHIDSVREMLRVAKEARIFPLVDVNTRRSAYVDKVIGELDGYDVRILKVDYEFQVGGNQMMVVKRRKPSI